MARVRVDVELNETVSRLGEQLGPGCADMRDMKSLLALQNHRKREMTRLWSEGGTSDEEPGELFQANRARQRAEVLAQVGEGSLGQYRSFPREGGLGGRFSFLTGPRENWLERE